MAATTMKALAFFILIPLTALCQTELDKLVGEEEKFAAFCGANGVAKAWVEFFSDDGIVFTPHPKDVGEVYGSSPVSEPPQSLLYWEPYHGTIAGSADLGFNTGPWKNTSRQSPATEPAYGYFFSVWKKQLSGEWKVLLDLGTSVTRPGAEHVFGAEYDERVLKYEKGRSKAKTLEEAEYLFNVMATNGMKDAYSKMASVHILSMLSGFHPFYNKRSLVAWLSSAESPYERTSILCSTIQTETAASGNLGYSYGSYEIKGTMKEKGHYVRIWKQTTDGVWYLFAEVLEDNVKRRTFN